MSRFCAVTLVKKIYITGDNLCKCNSCKSTITITALLSIKEKLE